MATIKTFGEFEVTPDTTRDALYSELIDEIKNALENAYDSDIFDLLNEWRESNSYETLREMCEGELNDALDGYNAWDIINMEIDTSDEYFTLNGYGDITTTCDVWHDCDSETIAEWIAENEDAHGVSEIDDIFADYNDALEALDEMEDEDEDEDARQAEKMQERAAAINTWVEAITRGAIAFNEDEIDGDISEATTALKVAIINLYNAVQGDG